MFTRRGADFGSEGRGGLNQLVLRDGGNQSQNDEEQQFFHKFHVLNGDLHCSANNTVLHHVPIRNSTSPRFVNGGRNGLTYSVGFIALTQHTQPRLRKLEVGPIEMVHSHQKLFLSISHHHVRTAYVPPYSILYA